MFGKQTWSFFRLLLPFNVIGGKNMVSVALSKKVFYNPPKLGIKMEILQIN